MFGYTDCEVVAAVQVTAAEIRSAAACDVLLADYYYFVLLYWLRFTFARSR